MQELLMERAGEIFVRLHHHHDPHAGDDLFMHT